MSADQVGLVGVTDPRIVRQDVGEHDRRLRRQDRALGGRCGETGGDSGVLAAAELLHGLSGLGSAVGSDRYGGLDVESVVLVDLVGPVRRVVVDVARDSGGRSVRCRSHSGRAVYCVGCREASVAATVTPVSWKAKGMFGFSRPGVLAGYQRGGVVVVRPLALANAWSRPISW